jgi:hypothetical protein
MSDHIDGPRVKADPAIDLTDLFAFASPADPTRTVLVACVFPSAGESALFSNAVNYSIALRRATVTGLGDDARFDVDDLEIRFTCRFGALERDASGGKPLQRGTCTLPDGQVLTFLTDDENGAATPDGAFRVFAGLRSDPFFVGWVPSATKLQPTPNLLQDDNVLCIVIEFETELVLEPARGSLFGAIAEVTPQNPAAAGFKPADPPRYDWLGRPEQTNFRLNLTRTPDEPDLRDLWNQQTPFSRSAHQETVFRDRLETSLARWDMFDGKCDWTAAALAASASVFIDDFLLFDVSRPITDDSHLEIEKSTLSGSDYQTGGGRTLDANVVDILVNWLVSRDQGPMLQGGATGPTQWSTRTFPYAAPPNMQMIMQSQAADVGAPADRVWDLIKQFDRNWHPLFVDIGVTGTGIGQLRTLTSVDGTKMIERLEELDDERRTLRYSLISGIPAAGLSGILEVQVKDPNSTVNWRVKYRPDGQPELAVKTIVGGLLKAGLAGLSARFGPPQ